jgi:hypothetical protein
LGDNCKPYNEMQWKQGLPKHYTILEKLYLFKFRVKQKPVNVVNVAKPELNRKLSFSLNRSKSRNGIITVRCLVNGTFGVTTRFLFCDTIIIML